LTRFPEQHFSAAVLCNSAETNPSGLVRQVADIFLAKDLKATQPTPVKEPVKSNGAVLTTEQMAAVVGTYWNRENDGFVKIWVKDGKLQISNSRDGDDDVRGLKPAGEGIFHVADVPSDNVEIRFVPATAEKPRRLEVIFGAAKTDIFETATAFDPTAKELAEYAGSYVSEEVDPVYRIVFQEGNLNLTWLKHKAETLRPTVRDVFTTSNTGDLGYSVLRFTRDANGHISGFILNTGRIQNFRFSRKTD
jgi:hypothetical protein